MFKSLKSVGAKPSIARVNELKARENIEAKIRILALFLSDLEGGADSSFLALAGINPLPKTARQFNAWKFGDPGDNNSIPVFSSNAQATLKRNPDLQELLGSTLKAIESANRRKSRRSSGEERMVIWKQRVATLTIQKEILEKELAVAWLEIVRLRDSNDLLSRKYQALERETVQMSSRLASGCAKVSTKELRESKNVVKLRGSDEK